MSDNMFFLTDKFVNAKKYWEEKLSGELHEVKIYEDFNEKDVSTRGQLIFDIKKETAAELLRISKGQELPLFVFLTTVLKVVLYKYTNQSDITLTSTIYSANEQKNNNYVLIRDSLSDNDTFKETLMSVKKSVSEAYQNQHYPLDRLFEEKIIDADFDPYKIIVFFSGIHRIELIEDKICKSKNDFIFSFTKDGEELKGLIDYASSSFSEGTVEGLAQCYSNALNQIVYNLDIKISEISILKKEDIEKILEFGEKISEDTFHKTINEIFEEQVEKTPQNIALIYEGKRITYKKLNNMANNMAINLLQKGVAKESIVGLMLKNSIELIVGILGILKAGGAYLPIDPEYPLERVRYMLDDSGAKVLVTDEDLVNYSEFGGDVLNIKSLDFENIEEPNHKVDLYPDNLAYVIYTSGSTGNPKGVMIEHKSVVNFISWRIQKYGFKQEDVTLQLISVSFDGFGANLYSSLLSGGTMVLPKSNYWNDFAYVKDLTAKLGVTNMSVVPSMYRSLLDYSKENELSDLRFVVLAAERTDAATINLSNLINPQTILINEYGPTENTTATTSFMDMNAKNNSIIGKPVTNSKVYILNGNRMAPVGATGEICISGCGLARGYLNKPILTSERFVSNPFSKGEKMYRTGDRGRWLPDGNVEFIGRMDNQVKVRGYRVELGEIEAALQAHPSVEKAVVIAKEDNLGNKYICAYIIYESNNFDAEGLKDYITRGLPGYMVPAFITKLDRMPILPNGKIDIKSLYSIVDSERRGADYQAPENEVEEKIAQVWKEVLGVDKVSRNDSFYKLGGDSIKAIQISAKIYKLGFELDMKDLFQHPIVCELAHHVKPVTQMISQEMVVGDVEFTPIQRWFFDSKFMDINHFNHAVAIYRKDGFNKEIIKLVFEKIVEHHDALRMIFSFEGDKPRQYIRDLEEPCFHIEEIDFKNRKYTNKMIEDEANRLHKDISLDKGPLIKLGLFKTSEGDHLLIIIHHIIIDGISWRIILEDFAKGYGLALNMAEILLPDKTHSYKEWADKLIDYANSEDLSQELQYWDEICNTKVISLPKDGKAKDDTIGNSGVYEMDLSEEYTDRLLKNVNTAYNTEVNDILLAALGMAIKHWSGLEKTLINLEGHGRENVIKDINISRTVGWFTTNYPVVIDSSRAEDLSYHIKSVKEGLRKIPNKGMTYSILKYIKFEGEQKLCIKPEISFNYFGQFDNSMDSGIFSESNISVGEIVNAHTKRQFVMDINGMVVRGKLKFTFSYNKEQYNEQTVINLAQYFSSSLVSIICHCEGRKGTENSPSDFIYNKMTITGLDDITKLLNEKINL